MENIQKAIEQIQLELNQKWQEKVNNDTDEINREILCLTLRLQRMKEAAETTEPPADVPKYGKYSMPEEYLKIAKFNESDLICRMLGEESNDHVTVSAAARLSDMIDRTELLKMAAESMPHIPELPDGKDFENRICNLAGQDGTLQAGILEKTWSEICAAYRDEWRLRLKFIDIARGLAHSACDDLITMTRYLRSAREEIQRIGKEKGSPDEIVKDNRQITTWLEIRQIPHNDNDRLSHALYEPKGEEL